MTDCGIVIWTVLAVLFGVMFAVGIVVYEPPSTEIWVLSYTRLLEFKVYALLKVTVIVLSFGFKRPSLPRLKSI